MAPSPGAKLWNEAEIPPTVGTAAIDGVHSGRLAVEQIFGYMVRNWETFGILTTMKGWCFLHRQNGGILRMTRMFGDFPPWGQVTEGAVAEGYYPTPNFSIMKALFYLSHLVVGTDDTPLMAYLAKSIFLAQIPTPPARLLSFSSLHRLASLLLGPSGNRIGVINFTSIKLLEAMKLPNVINTMTKSTIEFCSLSLG